MIIITDKAFYPIKTKENHAGYYKRAKNKILFYNDKRELFTAAISNKEFSGFVNARESNGRIFYQYSIGNAQAARLGIEKLGYIAGIDLAGSLVNGAA